MVEFVCASCGSDNEISSILPLICEICGCAETSDHVIKPCAAMRYPSVPATSAMSCVLDQRTSEEPSITKPERRLKLGAAWSSRCSASKAGGPSQVHPASSAGSTLKPALVPALSFPVLAPSLPDCGPHSEHRARAAGDVPRDDGAEEVAEAAVEQSTSSLLSFSLLSSPAGSACAGTDWSTDSDAAAQTQEQHSVAEVTSCRPPTCVCTSFCRGCTAATQGMPETAQDEAAAHGAGSVRGGQVTATMYTFSTALLESGGGSV